ncbi:receptor-type guanylate cyclase Gyc76C-like [Macrobrachium nipponense]|uniref:receptor-type guanylate cyclase Gyc76C-like n=1 Tax=Macrobrachium nipponense TaxID=159736 RepID=UPI0030C8C28D
MGVVGDGGGHGRQQQRRPWDPPPVEAPSASAPARHFNLGYLTGSERLPEDQEYKRPGLIVSGAITLAVEEVNTNYPLVNGHRLNFTVAETYGQEEMSILKTAKLWISNISAYIGPQETCVHEARMAAAFNLPMISYYSPHYYKRPSSHFDCPDYKLQPCLVTKPV